MAFEDHFSRVAAAYAAFRPRYPEELYEWVSALPRARQRAWDCACGSGQATLALAGRFETVVATDASAAQLARAPAHPRVTYAVAAAEASGIASASVDLVAVAQSLHWFELARFYEEARRVARPGAVLAAWCYGTPHVADAAIDARLQAFYVDTLGAYWPEERRHVESGYRSLVFPPAEIEAPSFAMRARWPLPQLVGLLGSWSAVGRYREARGEDPLPQVAAGLAELWGDPDELREVAWPLTVRAARLRED